MPDLWILKYKASSLLFLGMVNMNLQISSGVSHQVCSRQQQGVPTYLNNYLSLQKIRVTSYLFDYHIDECEILSRAYNLLCAVLYTCKSSYASEMKFSPSLSYAVQRGLLLVGLVHLPNITTYSVGLSALSGFCDFTNIRGQCAERKRQVVLHIVFKQVLKDAALFI